MDKIDRQLLRVKAAEGLNDLGHLLHPREWDEVPLVSRLRRIDFLLPLGLQEASKRLLQTALQHLDLAQTYLKENRVRGSALLLSLLHWDDFEAGEQPVIPNFFYSSDRRRDLGNFKLVQPETREARTAARWLVELNVRGQQAFDDPEPRDPAYPRRVYVVRPGTAARNGWLR
jgi:hypothetical protein